MTMGDDAIRRNRATPRPTTQGIDTLLIVGTGPGTGKSTVAGHAHSALEQTGQPVHCLYEVEALGQPEFGPFFESFRRGDRNMAAALRTALDRYLDRVVTDGTILVTESLLPFVRWLVLGDVDRAAINQFCDWLADRLKTRAPMLAIVSCDRATAVGRASADRGPAWHERWRNQSAHYPLYERLPAIDRWTVLGREMPYYEGLPWPTFEVDTSTGSPLDAADRLLAAIGARGRRPTPATLPDGRYQLSSAPAGVADLQELTVDNGHVRLAGIWLALLQRPDGVIRLERSNTTLEQTDDGLRLSSVRLGVRDYRRLPG